LRLYGSWTSGAGGSFGATSSFGVGGALHWTLSDRWQASLDASRYAFERRSITPFLAGASYGPRRWSAVRPYVELGAGYYRLSRTSDLGIIALGSSGYPRDQFGGGPASSIVHDAVGGYFGAGLDIGLTSRLGLDAAVRGYNWVDVEASRHEWDGMLALRSGLSYRF
jgi:hypothetical protein